MSIPLVRRRRAFAAPPPTAPCAALLAVAASMATPAAFAVGDAAQPADGAPDATADATADRTVELRFAGEFAGRPFDCGTTYDGVGTAGTTVAVTDYRLYVSGVRLLGADGGTVPVSLVQDDHWQIDDVALLDFEDGTGRCDNGTAETNAVVRFTAPEGEYTGIAFELGVPFAENHDDPTLQGSPLNLTSMFWNWQGGYRFLKLDTVPAMAMAMAGDAPAVAGHGEAATGDDADAMAGHDEASAMAGHGDAGATAMHGGAAGAWMLHVGSAGCASPSATSGPASEADCAAPNRARIGFDRFDPATDIVVVDPAAVLGDADLGTNAPDTAPGCMSGPDDPDCASVMPLLGLAWNGADAPGEQRLFRVRRDAP